MASSEILQLAKEKIESRQFLFEASAIASIRTDVLTAIKSRALAQKVRDSIMPFVNVEDWLDLECNVVLDDNTLLRYRLAWFDYMIDAYQEIGD
jgi:hypothetical protein